MALRGTRPNSQIAAPAATQTMSQPCANPFSRLGQIRKDGGGALFFSHTSEFLGVFLLLLLILLLGSLMLIRITVPVEVVVASMLCLIGDVLNLGVLNDGEWWPGDGEGWRVVDLNEVLVQADGVKLEDDGYGVGNSLSEFVADEKRWWLSYLNSNLSWGLNFADMNLSSIVVVAAAGMVLGAIGSTAGRFDRVVTLFLASSLGQGAAVGKFLAAGMLPAGVEGRPTSAGSRFDDLLWAGPIPCARVSTVGPVACCISGRLWAWLDWVFMAHNEIFF